MSSVGRLMWLLMICTLLLLTTVTIVSFRNEIRGSIDVERPASGTGIYGGAGARFVSGWMEADIANVGGTFMYAYPEGWLGGVQRLHSDSERGFYYVARFPMWEPLAVLSIWPCYRVIFFFRRWRRDRSGRFCWSCGYNLCGNTSGVCPECGQKIGGQPRCQTGGAWRTLRGGANRIKSVAWLLVICGLVLLIAGSLGSFWRAIWIHLDTNPIGSASAGGTCFGVGFRDGWMTADASNVDATDPVEEYPEGPFGGIRQVLSTPEGGFAYLAQFPLWEPIAILAIWPSWRVFCGIRRRRRARRQRGKGTIRLGLLIAVCVLGSAAVTLAALSLYRDLTCSVWPRGRNRAMEADQKRLKLSHGWGWLEYSYEKAFDSGEVPSDALADRRLNLLVFRWESKSTGGVGSGEIVWQGYQDRAGLSLWCVGLTLLALPIGGATFCFARRRQRAKAGCCPRCGRTIAGNTSGACPECERSR